MIAVAKRRLPATMAGALHSNCRCTRCRAGYTAWLADRRAALRAGTWQPWVDATEARNHIERLHDSGMSYTVIARLAKMQKQDIQRVRTDIGARKRPTRIRPATAEAILAVRLHFSRLPPRSLIPALGAVRRIQALRALGWPAQVIGQRAGVSEKTMTTLLGCSRMRVATHLRIASLYEEIRDQDPVEHGVDPVIVRRTRKYAASRNWAVPLAWSDIDTDENPNPLVRRAGFRNGTVQRPHAEVVRETAHLASSGVQREALTQRLGLGWDAITAAHRRAGVPLPLALNHTAPRTETQAA